LEKCKLLKIVIITGILWILASAAYSSDNATKLDDSVFVAVYIMDILKVDDVEQTVSIDFIVGSCPYDVITVTRDDLSAEELQAANIIPEILIINADDIKVKWEGFTPSPGGIPVYVRRYSGKLTTPLNFKNFPVDKQEISIELISPDNIRLIPDEIRSGMREELSVPNWNLYSLTLSSDDYRIAAGTRPGLQLRLNASRLVKFYVWNIVAPLLMIVIMAGAVFWIDPLNIAPQVGLATTSMLTMIAYRFAISTMVPQIPYMTRLDVFTSGMSFLIFLAFLGAILTSYLSSRDKLSKARSVDLIARWIFPIAVVALTVGAFWL
jgi:hypothetical protein